jgi:hypothetical protein
VTEKGSATEGAPIGASARWLTVAALLVAVLVRGALLGDKPFWRDEAWVAMVVAQRADKGVAPQRSRPAPPGFIALARWGAALPVPPEIGYRLPALVAGIALVPVLARLAAVLGAPAPIPLAVLWLAAGAPALVYYSRELKSYGLDALCAALAPLLALRCVGRGADAGGLSRPAAAAALTALVAAAPWCVYGGLFAIGALLAWGSVFWWPRADAATRRRWLVVCVVFALSFTAAYAYALAAQSTDATLHRTWRAWTFGHQPDPALRKVLTATGRYLSLSTVFTYAGAWPVLIPLALLGAATWARPGRALLTWLYAAPGALAIAAALLDRYLLAEGRLLLFAAPPLLLAAAAGLAAGGRIWQARPQALALAAAVILGLAWSARAIAHRLPPYRNQMGTYFQYDILHDVDALLDAAMRVVPRGGPVFVSLYASKPWLYYHRGRFADAVVCVEPCPNFDQKLNRWLDRRDGPAWLLLVDDERTRLATAIAAHGMRWREVATVRGGALWEITGQ